MKRVVVTALTGTAVVLAVLMMATGCCRMKYRRASDCPDGKCGMKAVASATTEAAKEAEISTAALQVLLKSGVPVALLDARTGKFDDGKRIPGARSLSPEAELAEITAVLPSKDALVVTYCSNLQCPASSMLAGRLHKMGYKNILEYRPGIAGWVDAGNAVESVK